MSISSLLNETHDPSLTSWVSSANSQDSDFPIQNLPFAVFKANGKDEVFRDAFRLGTSNLQVRKKSENLHLFLIKFPVKHSRRGKKKIPSFFRSSPFRFQRSLSPGGQLRDSKASTSTSTKGNFGRKETAGISISTSFLTTSLFWQEWPPLPKRVPGSTSFRPKLYENKM